MSSSSHQPSPYGHMNNIGGGSSNNIGGGSNHHNNNSSSHQDYDAEFEDGDNNELQEGQGQQLQQGLFEDGGPVLEDDVMDDSEEDTEEASETEMGSSSNHRAIDEPIEIKEQMYQDKLASLKKQLEELRSGSHPEYVRRVKKLEHQYNERIRLNEIYREYLISCVERDYILEKNAAVKEYEEKKIDLRENLMTDFEDRRKMIENERATMELTGDSVDLKPTITRKLRRRPNEPLPVPEKRRKPTSGQLVLLLDEKEVENDLKLISRGKVVHSVRTHNNSSSSTSNTAAAATGNGTASSSSSSQQNATNSGMGNLANSGNNSAYQQMNSSSAGTGAGSSSSSNEISIPSLSSTSSPSVAMQQNPTPQVGSNASAQVQNQPQQQQQQPQSTQSNNNSSSNTGSQPTSNGPQQPQQQQTQSQQAPQSQQPQSQPQQQPQQPQQSQQASAPTPAPAAAPAPPLVETRIEDGKLLYERRWFHRGQPVYVEGKDIPRFSANISAIGSEAIWVKKTSDGQKVRIFTNQLSRGKVSIKRRAN